MGGSPTVHLALLVYNCFLIFKALPQLKDSHCEGFEFQAKHYTDVNVMAVSHAACIVLVMIRKSQSKRTDFGSSIKTICKFLRVCSYMCALTWVLIHAVRAKNRDKGKYAECTDLLNWLHVFENYR